MDLILVESPTKSKTISRFVGNDYKIAASLGHIRDLPKSKLGVDVQNNFEPQYVIPKKAQKTVRDLRKIAKDADKIILATDEDREGEAIAWHLVHLLNLKNKNYDRIVFHEITPKAISQALENPRKIDSNLVDAQQARRVLDRLVGYTLSPLLWSKIRRGLSAGRVQSAALRLIVEREKEIQKFKPQEYWSIVASLHKEKDDNLFEAKLYKVDGKSIDKLYIKNEDEARAITDALDKASWKVQSIETKDVKRSPTAPFITSTLQQDANRKLGFSGSQTMVLAQQLYEGIEIGQEGPVGLITYMRTDSVNLSQEAYGQTRQIIKQIYGDDYVLTKPRVFKSKSKVAQEAHEAIRPTSLARTPEKMKQYLDGKQHKLYELIWRRTMASQMPEAQFKSTAANIDPVSSRAHAKGMSPTDRGAATTNGVDTGTKYIFRATGQVMVFDGFLKVYMESQDEDNEEMDGLLPELMEGEQLELEKLNRNQHFTQPPPRFTDASLVKTLEEYGIGRPSTYAPTIGTLITRDYVNREQKRLHPTEIGMVVSDFLQDHFSEIVDYEFTARMEEDLDEVANGQRAWKKIVQEFYTPFSEKISKKEDTVEKVTEEIPDKCPECGGSMVARYGRFGKFGACVRYPECKGTIALDKEEVELEKQAKEHKCPECGHELVVRRGRFGAFLGCVRYPECKGILKLEKKFGPCPKCGQGEVVQRRGGKGKRIFYACNRYPDCDYTSSKKPDIDDLDKKPA